MNEVLEFLKNAGVYYLATIEKDKPRVRPFGTINLFDGKLYIQTGKVKDVSKQMKSNPNIEISAMYNGSWIRIEAKAFLDERIEAQENMLDNYPSLKQMYSAGDGNTEVFYLADVTATISSFNNPSKVIKWN